MDPGIFKIVVLELDPVYRKFLSDTLSLNRELEITLLEVPELLTGMLHQQPHLILLSSSVPGVREGDLIRKIREIDEQIQVIVLAEITDSRMVVNLLQAGIFDYLIKHEWTAEHLLHLVKKARIMLQLIRENKQLNRELNHTNQTFPDLPGVSEVWKKTFQNIENAAASKLTISLWGEPGTGKTHLAKHIHRIHGEGPFIEVDFTSLPPESHFVELFGVTANDTSGISGKLFQANGGTLFLKGIGKLNMEAQSLLAKILKDYSFQPAGSEESIPLQFRLIVSNRQNLSQELLAGRILEELYFRLNGTAIQVPSLKERELDAVLLALEFIEKYAREKQIPSVALSDDARLVLLNYDFPGNIRELKSMVELAMLVCKNSIIQGKDILVNREGTLQKEIAGEMSMEAYTHNILRWYLKKYDGDIKEVARKLKIGKSSVYRIIKSETFQKGGA